MSEKTIETIKLIAGILYLLVIIAYAVYGVVLLFPIFWGLFGFFWDIVGFLMFYTLYMIFGVSVISAIKKGFTS